MSSTTPLTALQRYPEFEATIGIEVHVQLNTNSKIFCSCQNQFGSEPNTNICQICAGYPGVLPVLNRRVVESAIMAGIATNSKITRNTYFARKHYNYPDLPKKYQVTQDHDPICTGGYITISDAEGKPKNVRIFRIHMEEDAGKNIHAPHGEGWVDLNRAGTPLLEIVSEPDISSSAEAREYLTKLHAIMMYLGITDGNMEEGSFRADTNISVKRKDAKQLGTKVELKNINSFKFITQAIEFELDRQLGMIENGERIRQETRLWDSKKNQTYFMRSKEEAQDYRYFPEPDLPPVVIDDVWIARVTALVPELPDAKVARFQQDFGLSAYDAGVLALEKEIATFFEQCVAAGSNAKLACNWINRDLLGYLKEQKLDLAQTPITPALFTELLKALESGVINGKVAQEVFIEMASSGNSPLNIIKDNGLQQIGSEDELRAIAEKIVTANPDTVAKYKAGNERLFGFFVGQAMKETQGKGNPQMLNDIFKKLLG